VSHVTLCWYCGRKAQENEHRIPRSRGGDDSPLNTIPSCKRCNLKKRAMTVEEYRARLGGVVFFGEKHDIRIAPGELGRPTHMQLCIVCGALSPPVRKRRMRPWDLYSLGWRHRHAPLSGTQPDWVCVACVAEGWPHVVEDMYMRPAPPLPKVESFDISDD
jgi:hypothetical protein